MWEQILHKHHSTRKIKAPPREIKITENIFKWRATLNSCQYVIQMDFRSGKVTKNGSKCVVNPDVLLCLWVKLEKSPAKHHYSHFHCIIVKLLLLIKESFMAFIEIIESFIAFRALPQTTSRGSDQTLSRHTQRSTAMNLPSQILFT